MDSTTKVTIKKVAELEAIKKEKEDDEKLIYHHDKPDQVRAFQFRKVTLQEK